MMGKHLTIWREKLGLSQEDLAREIEVSLATVERWEKSKYKEIPVSKLLELALETLEKNLKNKSDGLS